MFQTCLAYKLDFYKDFFAYTDDLKAKGRSLIIAGDYNTAHNEILGSDHCPIGIGRRSSQRRT